VIPLAPPQIALIYPFFASNGNLYSAAAFLGAMKLETTAEPRHRVVRH